MSPQKIPFQPYFQPTGFPGLPSDWGAQSWGWEGAGPAQNGRKINIHCAHFFAKTPKHNGRTLIVIHGRGEHGGRYLHVPHFLQSVFDQVFCPDLRGHGRSTGNRGHIDHFDDYVEDTKGNIRQILNLANTKEVGFLAHSLGGLVGLRTLLADKEFTFQGAMFSAPALELKVKVPLVKKAMGYSLSRVWGSLSIPFELDPSDVSHDPVIHQAFQKDPLNHNIATPRYFTEFLRAMKETSGMTKGLRPPVFFIIPGSDPVINTANTLRFIETLEHPHKKTIVYPGYHHESLNEGGVPGISKEKVFADILEWWKTL